MRRRGRASPTPMRLPNRNGTAGGLTVEDVMQGFPRSRVVAARATVRGPCPCLARASLYYHPAGSWWLAQGACRRPDTPNRIGSGVSAMNSRPSRKHTR